MVGTSMINTPDPKPQKTVSSSQVTRWFHAFQHGPASQSRPEPCWDEVAMN